MKHDAYDTHDELHFISNIGKGKFDAKNQVDRKTCLEGYLIGARKRKIWGKINPIAVVNHAIQQLSIC